MADSNSKNEPVVDEGADGGNTGTSKEDGSKDAAGKADAGKANAQGAGSQEGKPLVDAKFTQADVDRIVRERLEREKTSREKAEAKAREETEAEALKKNQEWQKLAEANEKRALTAETKAGELEPLKDQVQRYKTVLEKNLEAQKKDLPKHVLVLLEKLDPVEQIEYLAANREALGKPGGVDGVPATPTPAARKMSEDDIEKARQGQAALYRNF